MKRPAPAAPGFRNLRSPSRGEALRSATAALAAAGLAAPGRDAQLLLLRAAQISKADLIAWPKTPLTGEQHSRYWETIERRKRFEPLQHILGEQEFYGLRFEVTPDVLIPRPETEHLVEAALEKIPIGQTFQIADIGTGSGVIAVAIAVNRPLAKIVALDLSPAALEVAKENAAAHGVAARVRFLQSDLLDAVAGEKFDMIVSNPPYIADSDRETLAAEVRDYEPAAALFAGPSGFEVYERLIPQAAKALRPGEWLLLEIGAGQALALQPSLEAWRSIAILPDLQGIPRVVAAQRP